ncbi:hypothetical protein P4133_18375 [Pseudomonas aeruginosa]|nr:hypothetical protein [Pseudomonas aeruginosa]
MFQSDSAIALPSDIHCGNTPSASAVEGLGGAAFPDDPISNRALVPLLAGRCHLTDDG